MKEIAESIKGFYICKVNKRNKSGFNFILQIMLKTTFKSLKFSQTDHTQKYIFSLSFRNIHFGYFFKSKQK